ncbi:hypothetical protein HRE53_01110 [Acaryochloris sp. 'Moss Beach']|uniref:hypothetical protein n=1 Tax=Acaryochloris sp. 'Moss Beach' TaxID=2740837 RepID=UPI001F319D2A|nr:hypothetical protein [Acaryochloris sp. 'Moss Beach']UJB69828.1 hypothetical protein HRE53_01110 [Acaryochloris sp. 'Moss Beach']
MVSFFPSVAAAEVHDSDLVLGRPPHASGLKAVRIQPLPGETLLEDRMSNEISEIGLELKADNLGTEFNSPKQSETGSLEDKDPSSQSPDPEPKDRVLTKDEIQQIQEGLEDIQTEIGKQSRQGRSSPGITISNPAGFGADNFTAFANFIFQERTRRSSASDAVAGFGIGFGDSRKNIGVQVSYSLASFGTIGRELGSGGFNAKIHRQFPGRWAVAVGSEGFLNIGDANDFDGTFYGSVTKIFNLRQNVDKPFSRLAVTAGAGTGRFRSEEDFVADRTTINPFGTATVLVIPQVSTILEWTGQDLAAGLSIAPFRKIPLVISPSVRDIVGAGENPRFVIGVGMSWKF